MSVLSLSHQLHVDQPGFHWSWTVCWRVKFGVNRWVSLSSGGSLLLSFLFNIQTASKGALIYLYSYFVIIIFIKLMLFAFLILFFIRFWRLLPRFLSSFDTRITLGAQDRNINSLWLLLLCAPWTFSRRKAAAASSTKILGLKDILFTGINRNVYSPQQADRKQEKTRYKYKSPCRILALIFLYQIVASDLYIWSLCISIDRWMDERLK